MKLETAKLYADLITTVAAPYCENDRCIIAGSIRRQRPEVQDIELVAIPRQGGATAFWAAILKLGWMPKTKITAQSRYVRLRQPTPRRVLPSAPRLGAHSGHPNRPEQLQRLAGRWVKLGYRGTEVGLLIETLCRKNGDKWEPAPNIEPRPERFQTEADFFEFLGLPWVEPSKRF